MKITKTYTALAAELNNWTGESVTAEAVESLVWALSQNQGALNEDLQRLVRVEIENERQAHSQEVG